jgi:predicted RecA/RadA family phage recombinase
MPEAFFVQRGDTIDYTPVAYVAAGTVVVQDDLVGITTREILAGKLGAIAVEGVFDVAKEAGGGVTFAVGALAYWDETNKVAVATDGGGAHKLLGKVVLAAADGDAKVRVRLCPCAVPAENASSSGS